MELVISMQPHMLLETVELLYAYVNELPVEALTVEQPYCIPAQAMLRMMDDVCAGLSRQDPQLLFFFEKTELLNETREGTCIARNMVYSSVDLSCFSLEDMALGGCRRWHSFMEAGEYPVSIDRCVVACSGRGEAASLAESLESLPVEQNYRLKLGKALENFDESMIQLVQLISPVAQKLAPYLEQQAAKTEPLFHEWEEFFSEVDWQKWMEKHCLLSVQSVCASVHIAASYIGAKSSRFELDDRTNQLSLLLSVGYSPARKSGAMTEEWEITALRLLGSPVRMRMIRALREQPMSTRELARKLGLHLGPTGRDISSMFNARLLLVGLVDGHTRYRLNPLAFDTLASDLLALKPETKAPDQGV